MYQEEAIKRLTHMYLSGRCGPRGTEHPTLYAILQYALGAILLLGGIRASWYLFIGCLDSRSDDPNHFTPFYVGSLFCIWLGAILLFKTFFEF